jgi:hypothetical protein
MENRYEMLVNEILTKPYKDEIKRLNEMINNLLDDKQAALKREKALQKKLSFFHKRQYLNRIDVREGRPPHTLRRKAG